MKNKLLNIIQNIKITTNYLISKGFDEKKIIKNDLGEDSIIFDIGSNLGSFIRFISSNNKNKNLSFYSFEPVSNLIDFQNKLELPDKHKLISNNVAITTKKSPVKFFESTVSSQSTIHKETMKIGKTKQEYEVEAISIDKYCHERNIENIDLLKIDTEGNDFDVLVSAKNLIENNKIKLIKIELNNNEKNFLDICEFLFKNKYELIGMLNHTYVDNKLIIFDCYFKVNKL